MTKLRLAQPVQPRGGGLQPRRRRTVVWISRERRRKPGDLPEFVRARRGYGNGQPLDDRGRHVCAHSEPYEIVRNVTVEDAAQVLLYILTDGFLETKQRMRCDSLRR